SGHPARAVDRRNRALPSLPTASYRVRRLGHRMEMRFYSTSHPAERLLRESIANLRAAREVKNCWRSTQRAGGGETRKHRAQCLAWGTLRHLSGRDDW